MSQKPTYFLTPPRPYPPTGPIRLGAIIPSPTSPDEPIYLPALPASTDVTKFTESNWSASHLRKSSSRFGIWASFLQMILSVGGDVEVEVNKQVKQHWEVENMSTMSFVPSESWLESVVKSEEVRGYLVGNRWREKVYLVTGVMVASSSSWLRETLEEKGVYINVGVDATAWTGIPIAVGPEGKWTRREGTKVKSQTDEEFVFAFRVREIRCKSKGGVKSHKLFDKGALFNTDKKKREEAEEAEEEVEIEGLGEEEDGEMFGLQMNEVRQVLVDEEDEECVCVWPEEL